VELRAAGLNWHDCLVRQGQYPAPLPLIPGADGSGVRRDTGEDVIILPSLWWGSDERFPASEFEILGDRTDGTYAELVSVPQDNLFSKPVGWDWEPAAALGLAGATAYRALFHRGGLSGEETVLILGAGSGVSTIAISLAAIAGARVLVTSSSADKLSRAAELGAAAGVLYTEDGWPEQIRELAGAAGVDVVIDSVGSTWAQALSVLNPGGRLVSFGATAGDRATVAVRPFYFGQFSILGTTMGSPCDFAAMLELIARRPRWRPVVDTVFPLEQAARAQAEMERRRHFGKLVLSVP
jgi:NADPH:quinone reductase-like Zn-dependent oxidoreductase